MLQDFLQGKAGVAASTTDDRRSELRTRIHAIPAWLTDLYHERVPVQIVNASRSGLGIKAEDRYSTSFPVVIECEDLVIVCQVRHCFKSPRNGYVLGLKINRIVEKR